MDWPSIKEFVRGETLPPAWRARAKGLQSYASDAAAFVRRSVTGTPDVSICFVHVPKCAGVSVDSAIRREFRSIRHVGDRSLKALNPGACDDIAEAYDEPNWDVRKTVFSYHLARSHTRYLRGHCQIDGEVLDRFGDEYAFVTILRDPVDRWISHYLYNRYTPEWHQYHIDRTIEEFVETERGKGIGQIFVSYLTESGTWSVEERKESDDLLERAKENLSRFDVVGFVEDMEGFRRDFADECGIELDLIRRNVNPASENEREIDPGIRERIREICQLDLELYEFARDRFN